MDALEPIVRDALLVTAILTLPVLLGATLAGGIVAVLQAATQVQEQTLTLLPKIVCVGAILALFGHAGLTLLCRLFYEIAARIPALVRG